LAGAPQKDFRFRDIRWTIDVDRSGYRDAR
jgi:hypothetical protein